MSAYSWTLRGEGEERRFQHFLISLIVLFSLYPVMVALDQVRLYRLVVAIVLMNATYTLGGDRRHLIKALVLGIPAILAQLVVYAAPSRGAFFASAALAVPFLVYVIVVIFSAVLGPGKVTTDRIAGAISVYLLLGLLWTYLYGLAAVPEPDSFRGLDVSSIDDYLQHGAEYNFIYYSFVTLTTLGYGDLTPTKPMTQTLAWMEAVVGQLFIVLTIARLVGLLAWERGDSGD